jgi:flagellar export protein FliJ
VANPRFPLETLLEYRRRQEEAKRLELTRRQRLLAEALAELAMVRQELAASLDQLGREQTAKVLDLAAIGRTIDYIHTLEAVAAARETTAARLDRECQEAREALIQASQESKVVDKLKESWQYEWRREELRQEDKMLAEAATVQFCRRASAD